MNTKLTLTIEKELIKRAKSYAKKEGRSLSDIIENYLKQITSHSKRKSTDQPVTKSLRGAFKMPSNLDYKEALTQKLNEKYG